jgi:hypothetical protein
MNKTKAEFINRTFVKTPAQPLGDPFVKLLRRLVVVQIKNRLIKIERNFSDKINKISRAYK